MARAHRRFRSILWRRGQVTTKFGSRNAGAARRSLTRSLTAAPVACRPGPLTPSSSALRTRAAVRRTRTLGHRIQVRARAIIMITILLTPSPFPKEETVSGWQAVRSARLQVRSRLNLSHLHCHDPHLPHPHPHGLHRFRSVGSCAASAASAVAFNHVGLGVTLRGSKEWVIRNANRRDCGTVSVGRHVAPCF